VLAWLAAGDPASAHNTFVSSDPAEGAVLDASPAAWTVTFDKDVPLDSASGVLQGPDGVRTSLRSPRHGASARNVVFDLPPDLSGAYTARWRLVGTDGHVISGRVSFRIAVGTLQSAAGANEPSVGAPANAVTPSPQPSEPAMGDTLTNDDGRVPTPVRWMVRLLTIAVLTFAFGLLTTDFAVAHGAIRLVRRTRSGRAAIVVIVVAPLLEVCVFFADVTSDGALSLQDALGTSAGTMLAFRIAASLATALCFATLTFSPTGTAGYGTALTALLTTTTTVSWVGHPRSEGSPWLGVPLDVAHIASMGAWLGTLAVTFGAVARHLTDVDLQRALRRFGSLATWSVAVLIATGTAQSLRLHDGVPSGQHGAILAAKLVFVAGMLVLATRVRRVLQRDVAAERGTLGRLVLAEICTGATALGLSAALVLTSPT